MKMCKKCGFNKPLDDYGDNKNNKDGKAIYCKECERQRGIEYRLKNPNKVKESSKKWRQSHPETYKNVVENYLEKNPHMSSKERLKIYRQDENFRIKTSIQRRERYQNNIDSEREKNKKYYHDNKEVLRKRNNKWKNDKRKNDGFYRMKINLRHRIREYLLGESQGKRTMEIVGLDKMNFKLYIENKFVDGMSWENYGDWHLDHIIPLCTGKNNQEVLALNHYTNLQPLWAIDNLKKNRKI
jgi:hypothetical protein